VIGYLYVMRDNFRAVAVAPKHAVYRQGLGLRAAKRSGSRQMCLPVG
jgi:hypothetical protein